MQFTIQFLKSVRIDYINKEVKIRKDSLHVNNLKTMQLISELKNTNDIHAHPNIMFNCLLHQSS
jgi:hypothetical protein